MKRICILIILVVSVLRITAQESVEVSIDSIQMFVGQQVHVTLTAHAKENAKVEFPVFKPTQYITPGVEVLASQEQAQQTEDNGFVARSTVYTLTSFDDTLYYLPPMTVKIDGKPYKSKSLALKVLTIEVDTTHVDQFFGPKDVQDNPFQWSDWSLSFWLSVLLLVFLAVTYYLYLRLRDNKPIIKTIRIVKRLLPHQKAMQQIEQIKAEKMVSAENSKEYYTRLTDTLRKYIEERYGNLVNAIAFIDQTKLENVPVEETIKPQLTEEDQRSQKARRVLQTVITILGIASTLLFAYVVYTLYQLLY